MSIKGLLIGSAAAIVAASGAQAADAIVAAEPEAVEYVRVCDSFGTGFFYIPGSETCLKLSGYVRFQTNFKDGAKGSSDWNSFTRAQLNIDARTETDLGALRSFIALRGQPDAAGDQKGVWVDQAYIELAGLRAGKFYSWWDDGLYGETDKLDNKALFNSVRYTYDAGAFTLGAAVDELDFAAAGNDVGVSAQAAAKFGIFSAALLGGYDGKTEEGSVRAIAYADVGPGTLGVAGIWSSGANAYYDAAEWTVAAEYSVNVTEKLKLTPGVQYFNNVNFDNNVDAWKAGLTADYAITSGLTTKVHVDYTDTDNKPEVFTGFVRLQRSF